MNDLIPAPSKDEAAAALERVRLKAAINLEILSEQLTLKGIDPTATMKAIVDAAEFNYKLSGMALKVEQKATNGFSLTINIGEIGQNKAFTIQGTTVQDEIPSIDLPSKLVDFDLDNPPIHAFAFDDGNGDLIVDAEIL